MAQPGDVILTSGRIDPQLGQQGILVQLVRVDGRSHLPIQQPGRVHGGQKIARLGHAAQAIQTHRIQPFENVAVLAMLGRTAMRLHEPQDVLETCDQPLLLGRMGGGLVGCRFDAQRFQQVIVVHISHGSGPPWPSLRRGTWQRRPHLLPYAFPRRRPS